MIRLVSLFSIVLTSYSQHLSTYQSFLIDNKEAVWMQVYHELDDPGNDPSQQVFKYLKINPWVTNVHYDGKDIVGDLDQYKIDYKRYGGGYLKTSNLIRTGKWSGRIRINFKDGKYRVVVYGLTYKAIQPERRAGKVSLEAHEVSGTLSAWALNDFRSGFKKSRFSNLDLIHFNLKDLFTLTETQVIDSDW